MPITFTVDHAQRLVIVVATGVVTRDTVVRYFDTQRMLNGLTYPRIVECRHLESQLTGDDWRAVAGWLRETVRGIPFGPAAVVVDNEHAYALVEMVSILVSDICALAPFGDRDSAEQWLTAAASTALPTPWSPARR